MLCDPCFKCSNRLPCHLSGDDQMLFDFYAVQRQLIPCVLFVIVCHTFGSFFGITLFDRLNSGNCKTACHAGLGSIGVDCSRRLYQVNNAVHELCRDRCSSVCSSHGICRTFLLGHFAQQMHTVTHGHVFQPCCAVFRTVAIVGLLWRAGAVRRERSGDSAFCACRNTTSQLCPALCHVMQLCTPCFQCVNLTCQCVNVGALRLHFYADCSKALLYALDSQCSDFFRCHISYLHNF